MDMDIHIHVALISSLFPVRNIGSKDIHAQSQSQSQCSVFPCSLNSFDKYIWSTTLFLELQGIRSAHKAGRMHREREQRVHRLLQ